MPMTNERFNELKQAAINFHKNEEGLRYSEKDTIAEALNPTMEELKELEKTIADFSRQASDDLNQLQSTKAQLEVQLANAFLIADHEEAGAEVVKVRAMLEVIEKRIHEANEVATIAFDMSPLLRAVNKKAGLKAIADKEKKLLKQLDSLLESIHEIDAIRTKAGISYKGGSAKEHVLSQIEKRGGANPSESRWNADIGQGAHVDLTPYY